MEAKLSRSKHLWFFTGKHVGLHLQRPPKVPSLASLFLFDDDKHLTRALLAAQDSLPEAWTKTGLFVVQRQF
jgi:hypothetical protein